jgi:ribosomal protein S6
MEENEKELKEYEAAFLIDGEEYALHVVKILKARGASVVFESPVKKIDLSYPIKKRRSAYFGFVHFRCFASDIENIDEDLRLNDKIIRHLIVAPPINSKAVNLVTRRPSRATVVASSESSDIAKQKKDGSVAASSVVARNRGESEQDGRVSQEVSNEELEKKLEEILK